MALNNVILMGRLTGNPEIKTTQSGKSVTSFSIAVDRDYQSNGEKLTDFINIVAWGKTAEFIGKWFNKGSLIVVNGSIETRKYTDKQGNNRVAFEVRADRVYFGGGKNEQPAGQSAGQTPVADTTPSTGSYEEMPLDDDLPF